MRPSEVFTIATRADPENAPFNVVVYGQGISVWVNAGLDAEVFDAQGGLVPSGHQRPDGVSRAQPDDQRGDRRRAEVDVAALGVARGDRAKLLELVDRPFDGVALLVALGVEARWPPAVRTFALAGGLGVGLLQDGVRDTSSPQVPANEAVAVRLVRSHAARPAAGPADGPAALQRTAGQREPTGRPFQSRKVVNAGVESAASVRLGRKNRHQCSSGACRPVLILTTKGYPA